MNQRKFGRTDLQVSELCLGAQQFGGATDASTAFAILDAFQAAGGNFIQSSSAGGRGHDALSTRGCSEELLGAWLRERRVPRETLVLGMQVRLVREPGQSAPAFAARVRAEIEGILRRLGTPYLDLLVCEWGEVWTPPDDVLRALEELRRAGWLRHVGARGFPAWRLMECLCHSLRRDWLRFELAQAPYSLLARAPFESELRELVREHRLAFVAQSPLAGGALLERLRSVACEHDATPAQVALAWTLRHPEVTATLIDGSSVEHVHEAVRASRRRDLLAPLWNSFETAAVPAAE